MMDQWKGLNCHEENVRTIANFRGEVNSWTRRMVDKLVEAVICMPMRPFQIPCVLTFVCGSRGQRAGAEDGGKGNTLPNLLPCRPFQPHAANPKTTHVTHFVQNTL